MSEFVGEGILDSVTKARDKYSAEISELLKQARFVDCELAVAADNSLSPKSQQVEFAFEQKVNEGAANLNQLLKLRMAAPYAKEELAEFDKLVKWYESTIADLKARRRSFRRP